LTSQATKATIALMRLARRVLVRVLVGSLMLPFTIAGLGAVLQTDASDTNPPTPIEQALMEHVCRVVPTGGAP
jgi:hypothetical protein